MRRVQMRERQPMTGDQPRDFFRLIMRLRFGLRFRDADLIWFTCLGYTNPKTLQFKMGLAEASVKRRRQAIETRLDVKNETAIIRPVWFLFNETCRVFGVDQDVSLPVRSVGLEDDSTIPLFVEDGMFYQRHWRKERDALSKKVDVVEKFDAAD